MPQREKSLRFIRMHETAPLFAALFKQGTAMFHFFFSAMYRTDHIR
jgi:hypothetical protein